MALESSAFRMRSSTGCRYHLELFMFLRRRILAYSTHLIWLATMEKNPEALDLMLRNKAFERLQGLYVKVVNGKPVIVNLSADKKSKLQPQGLRMSVLFVFVDAYVNAPVTNMAICKCPGAVHADDLKMHGISRIGTGERAEHPTAGAYRHVDCKRLWDSHINLTGDLDLCCDPHVYLARINNMLTTHRFRPRGSSSHLLPQQFVMDLLLSGESAINPHQEKMSG